MPAIQVSNLSFAYPGSYDPIFEDVHFQIDTDWKLGFTGRNGRGKTTFLNLLQGKYEYGGQISAPVAFDYFPFPVEHSEYVTADVIEEIVPGYELWKLARELNLLKVSEDVLDRPFESLSPGEQTKVLLGVLFIRDNRFLLIDEPTKHLDFHARKLVGDYLSAKRGFILVSHDRAFLDRCVDHILSINKTNIEIQKGSFSSWWMNKTRQDAFELAQNEKLHKDIQRLSTSVKRASGWSHEIEKSKNGTRNSGSKLDKGYVGHKAAKMMKRAKSIEQRQNAAVEKKSKLLRNIEQSESLAITQLAYPESELAVLDQVAIYYGERPVCENVCLTIEQGDRIAISGPNGSGKSSLLRLLNGESLDYTGSYWHEPQLRISYVPQSTAHLHGSLSDYAAEHGIDESLFKLLLGKLDFASIQLEKDMSTFSGGQKKKVLIASSLCEEAHLHIWDEPLNFVDVISRMQIEELLLEYAPTIVFVEHDRQFLDRVATKTFELGGVK